MGSFELRQAKGQEASTHDDLIGLKDGQEQEALTGEASSDAWRIRPHTRLEGDSVVVETGLPVEGLHESVHYLDGTAGPGGRSFAMEKFEAHAGMKSFGEAPNPVHAVSSTSSPGGMILMRGDSELPTPNVGIYDH